MARKKDIKIVEEERKTLGNKVDGRYKTIMRGLIAKQTGKHRKK